MILGGIATLVSVFLPWLTFGFISVSGLQIIQISQQSFLTQAAGGAAGTVLAVAGIGILAIVCGWLVGTSSGLSGMARLVAAVAAGIGLIYGGITIVDLVRQSNAYSNSYFSVNLLEFIGYGIWVAFVGGVAIVIGSLMGGPQRQVPPQSF
jgi:hypothetical protein